MGGLPSCLAAPSPPYADHSQPACLLCSVQPCSGMWHRGEWSNPWRQTPSPLSCDRHGSNPSLRAPSLMGEAPPPGSFDAERATEPTPSRAGTPKREVWCLVLATCLRQRKIQINASCLVRLRWKEGQPSSRVLSEGQPGVALMSKGELASVWSETLPRHVPSLLQPSVSSSVTQGNRTHLTGCQEREKRWLNTHAVGAPYMFRFQPGTFRSRSF